jgi:hypothetical protein
MAKKPKIFWVTPLATATLVYVDKPDAGYQGKGGEDQKPKYKITLVFPEGTDLAGYEAKALEAIKLEWPKAKPASVKSALKDGNEINDTREEKDKERLDLYEGATIITGKSMFQPEVRDAKRNVISPKSVRGGDKVKAMLELFPCDPSGVKTIGVRLAAIQVIEKGSSGGGGYGDAFSEEEGYEGTAGSDEGGDGPAPPTGGQSDSDF